MRLLPIPMVQVGEYFLVTSGDNVARVFLRVEDPDNHTDLPVAAIPVDLGGEDPSEPELERFGEDVMVLV